MDVSLIHTIKSIKRGGEKERRRKGERERGEQERREVEKEGGEEKRRREGRERRDGEKEPAGLLVDGGDREAVLQLGELDVGGRDLGGVRDHLYLIAYRTTISYLSSL